MNIVIKIKDKPDIVIRLDARRTLDGNILIQDHPHMDIILSPKILRIQLGILSQGRALQLRNLSCYPVVVLLASGTNAAPSE